MTSLLPLLPALLAWSGSAQAEERGVVGRVDLSEATDPVGEPVVLVLTPDSGDPLVLELNDEGNPPDVEAADGRWSGSTWGEGDEFTVTLKLGDQVVDAGRVSWAPEDEMRDLDVRVAGGTVTAEAAVFRAPPPQPTASAPPATAGGEGGGGEGGGSEGAGGDGVPPPPAGDGGPGAAAPASSPEGPGSALSGVGTGPPGGGGPQAGQATGSSSLAPFVGLGLGLLALVALIWWWRQPEEDDALDLGEPLERLPEPGLVGPATPSLTDGARLWSSSQADGPALLRAVLATVARHHVVVLQASAHLTPPAVAGGPVYRVASDDPDALGALLQRLTRVPGVAPAAVVVVDSGPADDLAAALGAAQAALPDGVGAVLLTLDAPEDLDAPVLRCRRVGARWLLEGPEGRTVATVGPLGLHVQPDAEG